MTIPLCPYCDEQSTHFTMNAIVHNHAIAIFDETGHHVATDVGIVEWLEPTLSCGDCGAMRGDVVFDGATRIEAKK